MGIRLVVTGNTAPLEVDYLSGDCDKSKSASSVTFLRLFDAVWCELKGILGNAAAAVIVRRAIELAVLSEPELANIRIQREGMDYVYTMPRDLSEITDPAHAHHPFLNSVFSVLSRLTGSTIVQHLADNPVIAEYLCDTQGEGASTELF